MSTIEAVMEENHSSQPVMKLLEVFIEYIHVHHVDVFQQRFLKKKHFCVQFNYKCLIF